MASSRNVLLPLLPQPLGTRRSRFQSLQRRWLLTGRPLAWKEWLTEKLRQMVQQIPYYKASFGFSGGTDHVGRGDALWSSSYRDASEHFRRQAYVQSAHRRNIQHSKSNRRR